MIQYAARTWAPWTQNATRAKLHQDRKRAQEDLDKINQSLGGGKAPTWRNMHVEESSSGSQGSYPRAGARTAEHLQQNDNMDGNVSRLHTRMSLCLGTQVATSTRT